MARGMHTGPEGNGRLRTRPAGLEELERLVAGERGAILDALWEGMAGLPGFGGLDTRAAARVRDTVTWVFDTLRACATNGRGLAPEEVARLEAVGAERARQGVPLTAALGAFHDTFERGYRHLAAAVGDPPPPGVFTAFTDLGVALVRLRDDAAEAIRRGYHAQAALSPGGSWPPTWAGIAPLASLPADAGELDAVLAVMPFGRGRALVERTLGAVRAQPPERAARWLDTLQAVVESVGNVAAAAERLHLSRDGLRHRLRRIHAVTGLDMRDPHQFLAVAVALRLLRPRAADPHDGRPSRRNAAMTHPV